MMIRPPAGYCFVQPFDKYADGLIIMPDIVKAKKQFSGKVLDITPYPSRAVEIFDRGERVTVDGATQNEDYAGIIGKTVVYEGGQRLEGKMLDKVRLDCLLAVIDVDSRVDVIDIDVGSMRRCPWCKTDGEANMLTDGNGFCIQCGRNAQGLRENEVDIVKSNVLEDIGA